MSELTITLLRLGYLALLWLLVFTALGVLRKDIYGTRVASRVTNHRGARKRPVRSGQEAEAAADSTPRAGKLVVTDGRLTGTTIPLGASAILIGRAPACTLVLDDDYSSSRHARIFPQGSHWVVEDLGSTNGTFIGSTRLSEPTVLPIGTSVRIGQTILELQR